MQTWIKIKKIMISRIYTDSFKFCEQLNYFFVSISSKIHEAIPPPLSENESSCYLLDAQLNTMFDFSLTQIMKLKNCVKMVSIVDWYVPFKLTVKVSARDKLLNPEFWPCNIFVRKIRKPRQPVVCPDKQKVINRSRIRKHIPLPYPNNSDV